MDYKEKYEMALEGIQEILSSGEDFIKMSRLQLRLQGIFPELKESEDERIRKDLIQWINEFPDTIWRCHYKKDMIAWLEKQGEQKDFAPKVEPKFKVGDWIISDETHEDYRICKITNVENGNYTIESIYGYKGYNTFETFEKSYHLWTIQDAKDGDVLFEDKISSLPSHFIVIFKTKDSVDTFSSHCFIGFDGNFYEGEGKHYPENLHPATKEQRDLLFEKMKEAGYEWDAEKKELKKIEQSIDIPFGAKDSELQEVSYYIPEGFHAEIDGNEVVIKKGEQKPAWSEEDERMLNHIIGYIHSGDDFQTGIDWLKSLKDRVQLQPNEVKEVQEEPVSEDLEEEIELQIRNLQGVHTVEDGQHWWKGTYEELEEFARHFAERQKEQMMRGGGMISILIDKVNQVFDALEEANENQTKEIQNRFHYFSGWSYWCNHDNCDEVKQR